MTGRHDTEAGATARDEREVLLMRAGGLAFAVYADECEGLTPWAEPAPLPHAPACVLGVVSVRGRMRTVLDPARLFETLGHASDRRPEKYAHVASLAGDEQLALASETAARRALDSRELDPAPGDAGLPARATFSNAGETVYLLDPSRLFDAALTGTERRRRRT